MTTTKQGRFQTVQDVEDLLDTAWSLITWDTEGRPVYSDLGQYQARVIQVLNTWYPSDQGWFLDTLDVKLAAGPIPIVKVSETPGHSR
jgi:hypothetical protein